MGGYVKVKNIQSIQSISQDLVIAINRNNYNDNYYRSCKIYNDEIINASFANSPVLYLPNLRLNSTWSRGGYVYYGDFEENHNLVYIESISNSEGNIYEPTLCGAVFFNCWELVGIGKWNVNTHNSTIFDRMFQNCRKLRKCPVLDCSSGTSFWNTFDECFELKTVEKLIFNSIELSKISNLFVDCSKLTNVVFEGSIKLNQDTIFLKHNPKLTTDSIVSFINALEDNTGNPQYTITIGATNLAKLTPEQVAVATSKNILLA